MDIAGSFYCLVLTNVCGIIGVLSDTRGASRGWHLPSQRLAARGRLLAPLILHACIPRCAGAPAAVKSLMPGQDLTRVTIPAWFLESRSLLERLADMLMHPDLLIAASKAPTPEGRIKGVVRWFLSGFHYKTEVRQGRCAWRARGARLALSVKPGRGREHRPPRRRRES